MTKHHETDLFVGCITSFMFLGHYWLVKARKWNWNSPVHIQTHHQETLIEYMYITVTLTKTRNLNSVSK